MLCTVDRWCKLQWDGTEHRAVSATRLAAYQTQVKGRGKKVGLVICVRVGCGNERIVHSRSCDDVNGAPHLHSLLQSSWACCVSEQASLNKCEHRILTIIADTARSTGDFITLNNWLRCRWVFLRFLRIDVFLLRLQSETPLRPTLAIQNPQYSRRQKEICNFWIKNNISQKFIGIFLT